MTGRGADPVAEAQARLLAEQAALAEAAATEAQAHADAAAEKAARLRRQGTGAAPGR